MKVSIASTSSDSTRTEDVPNSSASKDNNALLNNLIAFEVLGYLSVKDQLNCRFVCGTWDAEVCRHFRKECVITFKDLHQMARFCWLMEDNAKDKIERDVPFANFSLGADIQIGHEVSQKFFENYGDLIRSIYLAAGSRVGCNCGFNYLQKILFLKTKNLCSLRLEAAPVNLSREIVNLNERYRTGPPIQHVLANITTLHLRPSLFIDRKAFVRTLLEIVPNLEKLSTDAADAAFCRNIFLPLILSLENQLKKLKYLDVGKALYFSNDQLRIFATRKFTLQSFVLHFNEQSSNEEDLVCTESLVAVLNDIRGTLCHLELWNHQPELDFELKFFPIMKKMRTLRLNYAKIDLKWLENMPYLNSLSIHCFDDAKGLELFVPGTKPHQSVSTLCLFPYGSWENLNCNVVKCVRNIAQTFPQLKKLEMGGDDEVMQTIYDAMPQLEELFLYGCITDEGITGIPQDICDQMYSEKNYNLVGTDFLKMAKFIGSLTKLRKLTVMVASGPGTMTEVSVFFGLLCCKELFHLQLNNTELMDLWKEEKQNSSMRRSNR